MVFFRKELHGPWCRLPIALCLCLAVLLSGAAFAGPSHHTEEGFQNIYGSRDKGIGDFLKWRFERISSDAAGPDEYHFPLAENDPAFLQSNRTRTTTTWVGHSTLLIQIKGMNILTDPHFSDRASPVQWMGPQRVTPPGLAMEDLPPIDVVLISHNHYDHLDTDTIEQLAARKGGDKTLFIVPLKMKAWFDDLGIARVIECDWWEHYEIGMFDFIAVPMHHWSKRSLFSSNDVLWAGWVVKTKDFRFIFLGDCGYSPVYKDIGRRFGPFDLAAIPIGAYEPRWFMQDHHVNPEEALQIHFDLQSRRSIAIHWGTFILTDEPLDEPPQILMRLRAERGLSPGEFMILRHGETIVPE